MKNTTILTFLSIIAFCQLAFGQNDVIIGKIDSVQSEILNEERKILIHVPPLASKNFPVIYLLDGDAHFTSVVGMVEQLSANNVIPNMIVVAIPNTNRTRDLTPTKAEPSPPMAPQDLVSQSGGGRNFLKFMEKELFPYVEKNYPTSPYRMFIGHSFGGLLVMDALYEKPDLFTSYISIDPSMWWDDKKLLNAFSETNLKDEKYKNKSLYLGIANTLEEGMDTISVKKAKGPMVSHINSIFETRNLLRSSDKSAIKFNSKYYENDDHGSAPLITTYDGLRFIFDFYKFEVKFSDVMTPNSDVVNRMKAHYSNVTEILGYDNKPNENMINGMGYQLMQMDKHDLAKQFFEMNVNYYPKSFNVYDSLGDYYLAVENKEKAKENFKKALALEENPFSRKKLEELKSED
ncbi:alpha/beta hydrolase-fold protein [uncultured Winogradskyella sp.]|uniref:alpha/beta hydrolase-fold protein n=1 Tax=uncultured Winogradskyella sp. TaxID=395353 RepID=UPI00261E40F1|nr:alpha/beta hydrolase-fold protein [uncultured Winogradskyella sp.]